MIVSNRNIVVAMPQTLTTIETVSYSAKDTEMDVRGKKSSFFYLYGGVAQLGEHLPCKQGVRSSNLLISTKPEAKTGRTQKIKYSVII